MQEDQLLVELVGKHGNKWTLISQEIGAWAAPPDALHQPEA
jgi:hypothetical protein